MAKPQWIQKIQGHLRSYFLAGLIIVVPVSLTVWVLVFLFNRLDNWIRPLLEPWMPVPPKGAGILATLLLLYGVGVLATNLFGRFFLGAFDDLLHRIPLIKTIYKPSRRLAQTLISLDQKQFKRVVMIEYPRPGIQTLAFVTSTCEDEATQRKYLTVFIPTSPNPTGGMVEIIPQEKVLETSLSVEEGLKITTSAGLLAPEKIVCQKKFS